jgi:TatD DNase family protein
LLIDTHCHLDAAEFAGEIPRLRDAALRAGVDTIVVPAVEAANFEAVRALAGARGGARCAYALGIHPMYVAQARDEDLELLREALRAAADDPDLIAVGEIGLDHFVPGLDRERQERFLVAQLRLAREFSLPVILHVRRAQDAVLKQLRRWRPAGGIAHAFNGSLQQAQAFLGLGFALGFGGAMTFERARQIRRLAAELPAEAHVLETDAPDIAPAWLHPARNEPAELGRIAEVFAELRGESVAAVSQRTTANAVRVLPRLRSVPGSVSGEASPA